jgi:hypothetical protein
MLSVLSGRTALYTVVVLHGPINGCAFGVKTHPKNDDCYPTLDWQVWFRAAAWSGGLLLP